MPKDNRAYHLWPGFNTFPRLVRSYYLAARGKFDRDSVMDFHSKLEDNLLRMREELENGKYQWGGYRAFWVTAPKLRQIESAPFRDRVVHHAMTAVMEPLLDPGFYHHSYACRTGRGTHRALDTLHGWMKNKPDWFYLQMDVAKYFPSIHRDILYSIVEKKIGDPRFLALIQSLLNSSPNPIGIPIGNLTSQLFANVYLNHLDQFIKRELRVEHYIRYMDDIVLLGENLSVLKEQRARLESFGQSALRLRFHPHKVALGRARAGLTYVGYRILPNNIRLRNSCVRRMRKGLKAYLPLDQKIKRLLSYQAHLKHTNQPHKLLCEFQNIAFSQEDFSLI